MHGDYGMNQPMKFLIEKIDDAVDIAATADKLYFRGARGHCHLQPHLKNRHVCQRLQNVALPRPTK